MEQEKDDEHTSTKSNKAKNILRSKHLSTDVIPCQAKQIANGNSKYNKYKDAVMMGIGTQWNNLIRFKSSIGSLHFFCHTHNLIIFLIF